MSNKKESAVIGVLVTDKILSKDVRAAIRESRLRFEMSDIPEPPSPPPVTNVCGEGLIPCHPRYDIPPRIQPPSLIIHPSNDEGETDFCLYHFFLLSIGFSFGLLFMKFINHFC